MARWILDGSKGFEVNGNVVTYRDKVFHNSVFNCMWEEGEGVSSGTHYWKIHFQTLKGGAGVGLTSKDHFGRGYRCESIKYHGNLGDGSRLLVGSFGPSISAGDVVGILASFENDRLKVYIDINGRSLGMAFDVPASTFKSVYPLVSFSNEGSATCQKISDVPDITDRVPVTFTDIEGDWKLKTMEENETISSDLVLQPITTLRQEDPNKYSWHVSVVNGLGATLTKKDGNWKTDGVSSTLMLGPPEHMELESKIGKLMEEVKVIKIDADGDLSITSDTVSTSWTRYDSAPRGFIGNPFY